MTKMNLILSDKDLEDLRNLATFPNWVHEEWKRLFEIQNSDPLPVELFRRIVEQADKAKARKGHAAI